MDLVCPVCGSDRVILLNYPPYLDEVSIPTPERPIAKCAACSHRLTAAEIVAEEPTD